MTGSYLVQFKIFKLFDHLGDYFNCHSFFLIFLTHLRNNGYFSSQIMQAYCIYIHIVYQNVSTITFKHPEQTECYTAFASSFNNYYFFNFKYKHKYLNNALNLFDQQCQLFRWVKFSNLYSLKQAPIRFYILH